MPANLGIVNSAVNLPFAEQTQNLTSAKTDPGSDPLVLHPDTSNIFPRPLCPVRLDLRCNVLYVLTQRHILLTLRLPETLDLVASFSSSY